MESIEQYAAELDYWKTRAEKAENRLFKLMTSIYPNTDRVMTMENRVFTTSKDGYIQDENFDFDAGLQVSGDFIDDEKQRYAEMIVEFLNTHNGIIKKTETGS